MTTSGFLSTGGELLATGVAAGITVRTLKSLSGEPRYRSERGWGTGRRYGETGRRYGESSGSNGGGGAAGKMHHKATASLTSCGRSLKKVSYTTRKPKVDCKKCRQSF